MKIPFTQSENSKQVESELLSIMEALQDLSLRIVKISYSVPFEDTRGRLQGYADIISSVTGNISDQFEFYK